MSCARGSLRGYVNTSLQNGEIETVFCTYSSGKIAQVNTTYVKSGGSSVKLRNFWEWTDCNGSAGYSRRYDIGAYVAASGHEYPFSWTYATPGIGKPNSVAKCVRGGVYDLDNGVSYTTRVLVP